MLAMIQVLDDALAPDGNPAVGSDGVPICTHPAAMRTVTTGMGEPPSFLCRKCGRQVSE